MEFKAPSPNSRGRSRTARQWAQALTAGATAKTADDAGQWWTSPNDISHCSLPADSCSRGAGQHPDTGGHEPRRCQNLESGLACHTAQEDDGG